MKLGEQLREIWRQAVRSGGQAGTSRRMDAAAGGADAERKTLALPSILSPVQFPGRLLPKPTPMNLRRFAETPVVREKPFLMVDAEGRYGVRVPSLVHDSAGITWKGGSTPGKTITLDRFYIAHAGVDTAATMNAQLDAGKNLLLTPGIYELTEPIRVSRPDTVVMGLGFAPLKESASISTA